jgi:hypothetical protein
LKKIVYIGLFILLLLQAGGLLFIYKLEQGCVRRQMAELVTRSDAQFTRLVMPVSQYENSRIGDDELRFDGKLYDVKSAVVTDNTVELLVLVDTEETEVVTRISSLEHRSAPQSDQVIYKLFELMAAAYTCPLLHTPIHYIQQDKLRFATVHERTISRTYESLSPPPELS